MKKPHIPALLAALAACCGNTAAAQDVFVYKGAGLDPVKSLANVRCIVFADAGVEFRLADGGSESFALDGFDYFTFFDRREAVSIADVSAGNSVSVACDGESVIVESSGNISGVEICSAEGVKIAAAKPSGKSVRFSLSPYASGVYLVRVTADGKAVLKKIIKK